MALSGADRARELVEDLRDRIHDAYPVGAALATSSNEFNRISDGFDSLLAEFDGWIGRDRAEGEPDPDVELRRTMHKSAEQLVGLIRHVQLQATRMEEIVVDVRGILADGLKS